jgi:hypothetical protein
MAKKEVISATAKVAAEFNKLFGQALVFRTEDKAIYDAILQGLAQDEKPRTVIERILIRDMADVARWRPLAEAVSAAESARRISRDERVMDRLDAFATSREITKRDWNHPREEGTAAWAQDGSNSSEPTATIYDWFLADKYFSVRNGRGPGSKWPIKGEIRKIAQQANVL